MQRIQGAIAYKGNKVQLPEPGGIKAQRVSEFDLGENVLVALSLRLPVGPRELIKKAKPYVALFSCCGQCCEGSTTLSNKARWRATTGMARTSRLSLLVHCVDVRAHILSGGH